MVISNVVGVIPDRGQSVQHGDPDRQIGSDKGQRSDLSETSPRNPEGVSRPDYLGGRCGYERWDLLGFPGYKSEN